MDVKRARLADGERRHEAPNATLISQKKMHRQWHFSLHALNFGF